MITSLLDIGCVHVFWAITHSSSSLLRIIL